MSHGEALSPPSGRTRWADPLFLAELFLASNLAFLGADIFIAHAVNAFRHPGEWIPVIYSPLATLLVVLSWVVGGGVRPVLRGQGSWRHAVSRGLGHLAGWSAIILGVAGLVFHLESQFFRERTVASLVYTAPFAAPLAYTGLGLLAILNRKMDARLDEWAGWVVLLAAGGFLGNFVLTLADHAINGFFHPAEWIGVAAAAFGFSTLIGVLAVPTSRSMLRLGYVVMVVQVIVGLLGAILHEAANLAGPMPTWWENILFGAPVFAPLLFADLAALGGLGLFAMARALPVAEGMRLAPQPG